MTEGSRPSPPSRASANGYLVAWHEWDGLDWDVRGRELEHRTADGRLFTYLSNSSSLPRNCTRPPGVLLQLEQYTRGLERDVHPASPRLLAQPHVLSQTVRVTSGRQEIVAYLRGHRHASRQEAMKALGVSAQKVRLAEDALAEEDALCAKRKWRRVLGGCIVLALGYGAYQGYEHWREAKEADEAARRAGFAKQIVAQEQAIYEALDSKDPRKAAEISKHLASPEEGLRLAALRYLASVDPQRHEPKLLELLDDPSRRVRLAAIQLVGRLPGDDVERELTRVVVADERDQADRMLALASIRARGSPAPRDLARRLLPALLTESGAVREEAARVMAQLTGERVDAVDDKVDLHARWAKILGGATK